MALDAAVVRELLKKLEADREAYLATVTRTHEILAKALVARPGGLEAVPESTPLPTVNEPIRKPGVPESLGQSSTFSVEDEATDDDESLFVQDTLPAETYTEDDLRVYLRNYSWNDHGQSILGPLVRDTQFLEQPSLFPLDAGPSPDRSHLSHHNVYEVGTDGAPLPHRPSSTVRRVSKSLAIWQALNITNADPTKQRQAVGKIVIVREPSPLLFGALHFTMNHHFDMDEIFTRLADNSPTRAYMRRAFTVEPRQQKTFVFSLKYFTIIGDDCQPKPWQQSDKGLGSSASHIPITRCCSTVALSLSGPPIGTVKNRARRAKTEVGQIYDPFSPWRVLSIQCFPDWKSTLDIHDSTKHYVNGPEAFLMTLLSEYRDAQKRFMEIHRRIVALATPPMDFMFNQETRDKLLFEDDTYTFSRRYFWAFQTLAIMSDNILAMIDAYRDTFTDDVWNGRDKTLWPGVAETSPRYAHWRRRMALLRKDFEREIQSLDRILELNYREQKDIQSLRDHLFSGTSVQESRKSVEQALITVQQGHNIKLLTLVTIFFLPLTFVTSIFGMTNMPPDDNFKPFGIVIVIICLPTYMLIGTLNTNSGLKFWRAKSQGFLRYVGGILAWLLGFGKMKSNLPPSKDIADPLHEADISQSILPLDRSPSTQAGIHARMHGTNERIAASIPTLFVGPNQKTEVNGGPESRAVKFHSMAYDRRASDVHEARRVSVSNIGPLSDSMDPEHGGRGILRSITERFERSGTRGKGEKDDELC